MNSARALLLDEENQDYDNNPTRSNNENSDSCYNESESVNEEDDMIYNGRTGVVEEVTRVVSEKENVGVSSYVFSKDFLPVRYDRQVQSDLPLRLIAIAELCINMAMIVVFVKGGVSSYTSTYFGIVHLSITCFFFIFAMFWLNYKVHMIFLSVCRLFIDLSVTKRNDKYYSGLEVPDFYVQSKEYPHVTIQIPVYKENLHNTIKPTIINCCREADRYMNETGAFCNIVVCDDGYNLIPETARLERLEFYKEVGVGFTARPHPSKYRRNGRFKKAGNLNFSMNYSAAFGTAEDGAVELENKRDELVALGACYGGDVSYGAYILLIDSDTRLPVIPMTENGCLKRLAKEMIFDGLEVLFIQCYTGPYMSVKSSSEKSVFHHTCSIYNSILIATAIRSMAPLVGHNAFLNMKALTECAHVDEGTGYYNFWSEDRISEDFDLMMRGCEHGYIGRYACHAGIFLEGVSFSYMTEYFKISKFACGAAELIYNPISQWWKKGILSSDLIGFVKSKEVEWYNKMIILAYIFNFIALAAAHFGLIYNLFFCEWLYDILPTAFMATNLLWESIFIWTFFGGSLAFLFGCRLGFDKWLLAKQMIREAAFLTCLYGSISVRFSIMSFTHLFNWNLSFGATSKDHDTITLFDWIKSTPMECTVYTFYTGLMIARIMFLTKSDKLFFVIYYGCIPLIWTIFLFWAGPIFWDILPRRTNKTAQASYVKDDMMFVDKYMTQLPNSPVVQKMKVGSNIKLPPSFNSNDARSISQRSDYASTAAADDDNNNSSVWSPRSLLTTTSKTTTTTTISSSLKNSNNFSKSNSSAASVTDRNETATLMKTMQEQMVKLEEKIAQLTAMDQNNSNNHHPREGRRRRKDNHHRHHRGRKASQSADDADGLLRLSSSQQKRHRKKERHHQRRRHYNHKKRRHQQKRRGSARTVESSRSAPHTTSPRDDQNDDDNYDSSDSSYDSYDSNSSYDDDDDYSNYSEEEEDEIDYEEYYIKKQGKQQEKRQFKSVRDQIKALESKLSVLATPSATGNDVQSTSTDIDDTRNNNNDNNNINAHNTAARAIKKRPPPPPRRRPFTPPRPPPSPPPTCRRNSKDNHTSCHKVANSEKFPGNSNIIHDSIDNNGGSGADVIEVYTSTSSSNSSSDFTVIYNTSEGEGDGISNSGNITSGTKANIHSSNNSFKVPAPRRMSSTTNVLRVAGGANHYTGRNSRSVTPMSVMTQTTGGSSASVKNRSDQKFKTPVIAQKQNSDERPMIPTFQQSVRSRLRSMSTIIINNTPRRMSIIGTSAGAGLTETNGDGDNMLSSRPLRDSNEVEWMDNPSASSSASCTWNNNVAWNNSNSNRGHDTNMLVGLHNSGSGNSSTANAAAQYDIYFKKESLSRKQPPHQQLHKLRQQQLQEKQLLHQPHQPLD